MIPNHPLFFSATTPDERQELPSVQANPDPHASTRPGHSSETQGLALAKGGAKTLRRRNQPGDSRATETSKQFRRLNCDEVVRRGDFEENEDRALKPWEGLSGFRADTFVKPMYRLDRSRPRALKVA